MTSVRFLSIAQAERENLQPIEMSELSTRPQVYKGQSFGSYGGSPEPLAVDKPSSYEPSAPLPQIIR